LKEAASVHVLPWLECPNEWQQKELERKFNFLEIMRPGVLKALEDKRRDGEIGSSLEAKLVFESASARDLEQLRSFEDILPQVFIVSGVEIRPVDAVSRGVSEDFPRTAVIIEKAAGEKCVRCWNYSTQVGGDPQHPRICERCLPVVRDLEQTGQC
jgi:isoleucyl-tRNA synthetase